MPPTRIATIALAGLLSASLVFSVLAQDAMMADPATMSPEELVEARQDKMKENGATLRTAGTLSGPEAVAAAETLMSNFELLPALFVEGSVADDSRALPLIWEEQEAFEALFAKAHDAAADMKTAAEAGDATAYAGAVKAVGAICGECHDTYRAPKQ